MSKASNPYVPPDAPLSPKGILRLPWRAKRNYKKLVRSKPKSDEMKKVQEIFQKIYRVGDPLLILIDTSKPGVIVPAEYIQEGQIVLDVCPMAVSRIKWDPEKLTFEASFSGRPIKVQVPLVSFLAIFNPQTELGFEFCSGEQVESEMP